MLNYRELKRRTQLEGVANTVGHLTEAIEEGHLKPNDFSLRGLFESLVTNGREVVGADVIAECFDVRGPGKNLALLEASGAVSTTSFSNITGQIVYSQMMESYQNEEFVFSRLIPAVPTRLDGEKIPGIGRIGDQAQAIGEGQPYPYAGVNEDYIETPSTTKMGLIVPVTKEAIFFDRTNLVLERCSEVGEFLGVNKEIRLIDTAIGVTNNYKWKGTTYNTYQTSTPWINTKSSNELVDWTDVDNVDQLFADMLDPNTGLPILINSVSGVVCPAYRQAANRVTRATDISHVDNQANAGTVRTMYANPMTGHRFDSSALMYRRIIASGVNATNAKKWWFYGNFAKAFAYMENWPISVVTAPPNSEAEFNNDIVTRFKASERGASAVKDPRYVVKSYDS